MDFFKKSVKVEINPREGEPSGELLTDAMLDAFDTMGLTDDMLEDLFFTLRVDRNEVGGVAATVTCSHKRG